MRKDGAAEAKVAQEELENFKERRIPERKAPQRRGGEVMQIFVKTSSCRTIMLDVAPRETIKEVKWAWMPSCQRAHNVRVWKIARRRISSEKETNQAGEGRGETTTRTGAPSEHITESDKAIEKVNLN